MCARSSKATEAGRRNELTKTNQLAEVEVRIEEGKIGRRIQEEAAFHDGNAPSLVHRTVCVSARSSSFVLHSHGSLIRGMQSPMLLPCGLTASYASHMLIEE